MPLIPLNGGPRVFIDDTSFNTAFRSDCSFAWSVLVNITSEKGKQAQPQSAAKARKFAPSKKPA
eukprot:9116275-Pyramimonas_sp.AAC.1